MGLFRQSDYGGKGYEQLRRSCVWCLLLTIAWLASIALAGNEPSLVLRGGHSWGVAIVQKAAQGFAAPQSLGRDRFGMLEHLQNKRSGSQKVY